MDLNGCRIKAYKDELGNLHILDAMGDKPYRSVTNGVDDLLPVLLEQLGVAEGSEVILYATDGVVSQFDAETGSFGFLSNGDARIHKPYYAEMVAMYVK